MNQNPPYVPVPATQQPEDELDLIKYLDVLLKNRWLIASIAGVLITLGVVYAFLARPVYEADILVQVEDSPTDAKSLLGDVSSLFDVKTQATAEIEILRSRMVVGKAVENLRLYIEAKPRYFPFFGGWIARRAKGLSEPGLFGLGGYAWASESINVPVLEVPSELEGEILTLTALEGGRYQIDQRSFDKPIEGAIGKLEESDQSVGAIRVLVQTIKAKPGTKFNLTRYSKLKTVEDLQDQLKIAERGKQSGVIGATLEGNDPRLTSSILNEIGEEYISQNIRRKSEEAEKSLTFLDNLLPQLKSELERAEEKYNKMRNQRGTFDLSEEGRALLQDSVKTEASLLELKQKRKELITRFQAGHPALQALDQQIEAMSKSAASVAERMKSLPNMEQDTLRLMRDVQVNNDLYVGLLNNMQQLKLVKAGKVGNVRLIDRSPVPEEPVKPKKLLVVALAAFIGLLLGTIVAFIRNALYGGITDPHDIEQHTGLNVYGTVPLSMGQRELSEDIQLRKPGNYILATRFPNEPSVESLRSLRTALQFALLDAPDNRILLTGPTPGVGKSFISVNLAAIMAAGGKRVLLVDADMRKGYLNQYLGLERKNGLSDVLAGRLAPDEVVHRNISENLDFIATGTVPPNPAELLMSKRTSELLNALSANYDLVIIDSPPVLAVADSSVLAESCGTAFLVSRFERTTIGEIEESAKKLRHVNVEVKGVIFNGLDPNAFKYGYGSKYGRYRYAYYSYEPSQEKH